MAVGLFFVFLEISRKLRFLLVLRMPGTSWMTRETYVVALFYPLLAADLLWPHAVFHFLVAATALAFLYCQGRILQAGKGIPAWRTKLMPSMLVATGLFEGFGLFALFSIPLGPSLTAIIPAFLGLGILAVVNLVLWRRYRSTARAEGIGPLARREIDALSPYLHVIGHGLPIVCVIAAVIIGDGAAVPALLALAGAGAVAGGIMWKFTVITRACHQQGFAIPKMPRRGSGARAAPERLHSI
jgi:phenylacetyl-CoA:acceptor oxidoreductase subunit 2